METLKLALPVIALVVAALAARGYRRSQDWSRGELVSGIAEQRDWRYFADEPGLVDRWPGKPFGRGSEQQVTNVVRGTWANRKFLAFDYSYVVHHTYDLREQEHVPTHFGVVVMQLPGKLPSVEVELGEVGWRIMGGDLLAWERGRVGEDGLVRRLEFLAELVGEIPRQVWSEYAEPDPERG
ncbi:hypothetical protein [Kribbella sp. NPDC051770]|uniref:hypothetical protein n=1 Tax=Kribbella sp. NPDC051770 TaxID=3155413 RepID=UPI0034259C91